MEKGRTFLDRNLVDDFKDISELAFLKSLNVGFIGSIAFYHVAHMGLGLAALIGTCTLGPIDLARTTYNSLVGDVPLIRNRAVEYCRRNIQTENPSFNAKQIEEALAKDLGYSLENEGQVNPQDVTMMKIWDATEKHASNWYERWVWPSFSK